MVSTGEGKQGGKVITYSPSGGQVPGEAVCADELSLALLAHPDLGDSAAFDFISLS